jgi:pyridoxal phosphate enzyme (YggS family)
MTGILAKDESKSQFQEDGKGTVSEAQLAKVLAERLAAVEERLEQACRRAGRSRRDVILVAVTKTISTEVVALLPGLGLLDLGENRPQELWRKAAALPPGVRWHLIGHLQRNKIERTLPLVHCLHAVDSLRLLQALEAAKADKPIDVLLEVNASGEASKQGFQPEEVSGLAAAIAGLRQVRVGGLMTMAAVEEDAERCRPTFVRLRQLRDQLQAALGSEPRLDQLSMGMSNDFEVAVEEGATLVRLGTVLFGDLPEGV